MKLGYSEEQNREKVPFLTELTVACIAGGGISAFVISAFGLGGSGFFGAGPAGGLMSAWNAASQRLGMADYIILPQFAGGYDGNGSPAAQGIFLIIFFIMMSFLAYLIIRSGNRWLLLIYLIPAAALMFLTGIYPGALAAAAFAAAMMLCFAIMGIGKRHGDPDEAAGERRSSLWAIALPAAVALIMGAAGWLADSTVGLEPFSGMQDKASEKMESVLHMRYGTSPLGNGRIDTLDGEKLKAGRGSISEVAEILKNGGEDKSKTALTVSTDSKDAWYLRGYVGENYADGRWSELDSQTLYRQRDSLYWLNRQGFDGLSQMSEAAIAAGDTATQTDMEISVEKADRSLVYTPYEITGTEQQIPEGTVNCAGGYLRSGRPFGSRNYTFDVSGNMTGRWTDLAGRLYSEAGSDAIDEYFLNESNYNVWCYEKYTRVPAGLRSRIYTMTGSPGDIRVNHAPYKEAISKITGALDKNFIYSEDFEAATKEGGTGSAKADPIETFIVNGRGCDAHYASLGTMMFRSFGIPARYVEGYLVTPRDGEEGGEKAIGFSHAHAWTEIYIDGLGWVPIEVTPAYEDIMPKADMDRGLEAVKWDNRQLSINPPQEDLTEEETPEEFNGGRLLKWLLAIMGAFILFMLLWLLYRLLRIHVEKRKRMAVFTDPDPRVGVCAMYGYMIRDSLPIGEVARAIGDMAAFSHLEVTEQQRSFMGREVQRGEDERKQIEKAYRSGFADNVVALFDFLRGRRRHSR